MLANVFGVVEASTGSVLIEAEEVDRQCRDVATVVGKALLDAAECILNDEC